MRAFSTLSAVLFFAVTALALTVTTPAQGASWDASKRSQTVSWNAVATDPSNFTIVLSNMQTTPNINVPLKENVPTSGGSTTVDGPSSGWPTGNGFQINLVQQTATGVGILAQSQQFNITGTTTPFSSVSSATSQTGTSPPTSETGSDGGSSGGNNGAMGLTVQTGFVFGLALLGALLA